jgi:hypothetical protein
MYFIKMAKTTLELEGEPSVNTFFKLGVSSGSGAGGANLPFCSTGSEPCFEAGGGGRPWRLVTLQVGTRPSSSSSSVVKVRLSKICLCQRGVFSEQFFIPKSKGTGSKCPSWGEQLMGKRG